MMKNKFCCLSVLISLMIVTQEICAVPVAYKNSKTKSVSLSRADNLRRINQQANSRRYGAMSFLSDFDCPGGPPMGLDNPPPCPCSAPAICMIGVCCLPAYLD